MDNKNKQQKEINNAESFLKQIDSLSSEKNEKLKKILELVQDFRKEVKDIAEIAKVHLEEQISILEEALDLKDLWEKDGTNENDFSYLKTEVEKIRKKFVRLEKMYNDANTELLNILGENKKNKENEATKKDEEPVVSSSEKNAELLKERQDEYLDRLVPELKKIKFDNNDSRLLEIDEMFESLVEKETDQEIEEILNKIKKKILELWSIVKDSNVLNKTSEKQTDKIVGKEKVENKDAKNTENKREKEKLKLKEKQEVKNIISQSEKDKIRNDIFVITLHYWLKKGGVSEAKTAKESVDIIYNDLRKNKDVLDKKLKKESGGKIGIKDIFPNQESAERFSEEIDRVLNDVPFSVANDVQDRINKGEKLDEVLKEWSEVLEKNEKLKVVKNSILEGVKKRIKIPEKPKNSKETIKKSKKVEKNKEKEKDFELSRKLVGIFGAHKEVLGIAKKNNYSSSGLTELNNLIKELHKITDPDIIYKFLIENKIQNKLEEQTQKAVGYKQKNDKEYSGEKSNVAKKKTKKVDPKKTSKSDSPVLKNISNTVDEINKKLPEIKSDALDKEDKKQIKEIVKKHEEMKEKAVELRKAKIEIKGMRSLSTWVNKLKKIKTKKESESLFKKIEKIREDVYSKIDEEIKKLKDKPKESVVVSDSYKEELKKQGLKVEKEEAPLEVGDDQIISSVDDNLEDRVADFVGKNKPETSEIEVKSKREVSLTTSDFFDILKTKENEMEEAFKTVIDNLTLDNEQPDEKVLNVVEKMFDHEPDQETLESLKEKGIDDWKEFQKIWKDKMSKDIAKVLNVWLSQKFKQEMFKDMKSWDKIKLTLSKLNAIKGVLATRILTTGLAVGGAGFLASATLATGGVAGVAVAGGAGAIGGALRGLLQKKWFGSKKAKEAQAEKIKLAEQAKLEKLTKKYKVKINEKILSKIFLGGERSVNILAGLLSEVLKETQKKEDIIVGNNKTLDKDSKEIYYNTLANLENEGLVIDEREQNKLAGVLYEMQENHKEAVEKSLKNSDPKVVKALDELMKAYGGRSEKGGILASSLVGGVVGTAFFTDNEKARAVIGGLAGGLAGYRIGEAKISKEAENRALEEFEKKILPQIKQSYVDFLESGDFARKEAVLAKIQEFKVILKGGGNKELAQSILKDPVLKAEIKSFISEVESNPEMREKDETESFLNAIQALQKESKKIEKELKNSLKTKKRLRDKIKVFGFSVGGALAGAGLAYLIGHGVKEIKKYMGWAKVEDQNLAKEAKSGSDLIDKKEVLPVLPEIEHPTDSFSVNKGRGITYALRDKIEANPEDFGYNKQIHGNLHRWATSQSRELAKEVGILKADGSEMRLDGGVKAVKFDMYQTDDGKWHIKLPEDNLHQISAEQAERDIAVARAKVTGGPAKEISQEDFEIPLKAPIVIEQAQKLGINIGTDTVSGIKDSAVAGSISTDVASVGLKASDLVHDIGIVGKTNTGESIHDVVSETVQKSKQNVGLSEPTPKSKGVGDVLASQDIKHEEISAQSELKGSLLAEQKANLEDQLHLKSKIEFPSVDDWTGKYDVLHRIIENNSWKPAEKEQYEKALSLLKMQDEIFGSKGEGIDHLAKKIDLDLDDDEFVNLKNNWLNGHKNGVKIALEGLKEGKSFSAVEKSLFQAKILDYNGVVSGEMPLKTISDYSSHPTDWARDRNNYINTVLMVDLEDI